MRGQHETDKCNKINSRGKLNFAKIKKKLKISEKKNEIKSCTY